MRVKLLCLEIQASNRKACPVYPDTCFSGHYLWVLTDLGAARGQVSQLRVNLRN